MDSVGAPPEGMFDQSKDDHGQQPKTTLNTPLPGGGLGGGQTLSLRQQAATLSPEQLISLVASQLTGEKTQQQEAFEQRLAQRDQRLVQLEQELLELARRREEQERQRRIQESQSLKQEIQAIGTPTNSVPTVNAAVSGSASEITLFQKILQQAREMKQRQQQASQGMVPKGQQKGPTMEGGAEKKVSMVDQMVSGGGQEKPKSNSIAPVELPLGE